MASQSFDKNSAGMSLGILVASIHVLWFTLVFLGLGQGFMDWLYARHLMSNTGLVVNPTCNLQTVSYAFLTVATAFLVSYAFGWLFASLYNRFKK